MVSKRSLRSRKPFFALLILLLVIGSFLVLLLTGHFSKKHTVSQAQKEASQVDANTKKQFTQQSGSSSSSSASSSPKTTTTDTATLNAATQNPDNVQLTATQTDSSTVTVKTTLAGYSDGSCTLNVTNGSKVYSQTVQVIYAPDFSSCAGFSVPISQLGTGTWSIKLDVTSRGNSQTKTISVEVS